MYNKFGKSVVLEVSSNLLFSLFALGTYFLLQQYHRAKSIFSTCNKIDIQPLGKEYYLHFNAVSFLTKLW